jgi:hypothetical protein
MPPGSSKFKVQSDAVGQLTRSSRFKEGFAVPTRFRAGT